MTSLLKLRTRSKGIDPHAFESIGSVLRHMRWVSESEMTSAFDPVLSRKLDFYILLEQHDKEAAYDHA